MFSGDAVMRSCIRPKSWGGPIHCWSPNPKVSIDSGSMTTVCCQKLGDLSPPVLVVVAPMYINMLFKYVEIFPEKYRGKFSRQFFCLTTLITTTVISYRLYCCSCKIMRLATPAMFTEWKLDKKNKTICSQLSVSSFGSDHTASLWWFLQRCMDVAAKAKTAL